MILFLIPLVIIVAVLLFWGLLETVSSNAPPDSFMWKPREKPGRVRVLDEDGRPYWQESK